MALGLFKLREALRNPCGGDFHGHSARSQESARAEASLKPDTGAHAIDFT